MGLSLSFISYISNTGTASEQYAPARLSSELSEYPGSCGTHRSYPVVLRRPPSSFGLSGLPLTPARPTALYPTQLVSLWRCMAALFLSGCCCFDAICFSFSFAVVYFISACSVVLRFVILASLLFASFLLALLFFNFTITCLGIFDIFFNTYFSVTPRSSVLTF